MEQQRFGDASLVIYSAVGRNLSCGLQRSSYEKRCYVLEGYRAAMTWRNLSASALASAFLNQQLYAKFFPIGSCQCMNIPTRIHCARMRSDAPTGLSSRDLFTRKTHTIR